MTDTTMHHMAQLYCALAKAQGSFEPIEKNRTGYVERDGIQVEFRYADLAEILKKTRKALSENGLALMQTMAPQASVTLLVCTLAHEGGGTVTSVVELPSARSVDPKAFGLLTSYLRRYQVSAILGVDPDDDLDGAARTDRGEPSLPRETERVVTPAERATVRADVVEADAHCTDAQFEQNWPAWTKALQAGLRDAEQVISMAETRFRLTDKQKLRIRAAAPQHEAEEAVA